MDLCNCDGFPLLFMELDHRHGGGSLALCHHGSVKSNACRWIRVARTRGTMRRTQRFEHRGLNVGDLGSQRNTVTEASSRRTHNTLQRGTPSFTQVQGPRGEVKPLLPAFLYYDATPRKEYKALITEL
jgi:hypothetical protein